MVHNAAIEGIVEEKLLSMHTAYVAKVISVSGDKAKIQPLTMIKQYGSAAQKPSPVTAYILENAKYKLKKETIKYVSGISDHTPTYTTKEIITASSLESGDVVFCVCADRDMTETRKGNLATPPVGHHSMSDSVIVGVL